MCVTKSNNGKKMDKQVSETQINRWKVRLVIFILFAGNVILGQIIDINESYLIRLEKEKFRSWAKASKEVCPELNDTFCPTECWTGKKVVEIGFLHQPKCSQYSSKSLLIYVYSAIKNFNRRSMIRKRFKQPFNNETTSAQLPFIIGKDRKKRKSKPQHTVDKEQENYGDLLQIDIEDSYFNLGFKAVGVFKWIKNCWKDVPQLVAKIDDDHLSMLGTISHHAQYILAKEDKEILKTSLICLTLLARKSTDMLDYFSYHLPDYCNGEQGIFMDKSVAMKLYAAMDGRRVFRIDDIYTTGLLRQRACLKIKTYPNIRNFLMDLVYSVYIYYENVKRVKRSAPEEYYTIDDFLLD